MSREIRSRAQAYLSLFPRGGGETLFQSEDIGRTLIWIYIGGIYVGRYLCDEEEGLSLSTGRGELSLYM